VIPVWSENALAGIALEPELDEVGLDVVWEVLVLVELHAEASKLSASVNAPAVAI
jgi:hypothetical protein